ncbi:MAG TPA: hypothetical protein VI997_04640, partial [Candidatus Thermoplasmatota archaeon]|nr:hypothetical protein [Candidatus Thermoplasmatota archaeon]
MARKRRSRIRSAGKVESKDILANARSHLDDPDLAQVECVGSHFFCPLARLNRALADVHARREDEAYLQRRSKSGRGLVKAYAGTLLLARGDGELPYVAQAKLPFGTYPYAMRGTAAAHHYLGLQHWDDPRLRLLAFSDFVKKKRFRFFAVGDAVVCTHRTGPVPAEYVAQEAERLGLTEHDGAWTCPHPQALPAVLIDWRAAGARVRVCGACGGPRNTAHALLENAAVPRPGATFGARAELAPIRGAPEVDAHEKEAEERYLSGEIGDAALLDAAAARRRRAFAALPPPFFVA